MAKKSLAAKSLITVIASVALASSGMASPAVVQPQQALAKAPAKVKVKSGSFKMSGGGEYIRTAKLSWKKVSKAKGYQIKMKGYFGGRYPGYGSWEKLGSTKKCSYKKKWYGAKMLVGGKFKVRAYKLSKSGKRVYGKWSAAKKLMAPGW